MIEFKNIHIVDDNELDRYLVMRCIKRIQSGINIIEHQSAEEFLEYVDQISDNAEELAKIAESLVTMDLRMPGIGGLEGLKGMQERISDGRLSLDSFKCIVLTSSSNTTDQNIAGDYNFITQYCVKPISKELLKELFQ